MSFDLNLLLAKTISEMNQWKPRNKINKYKIMEI